MKLWDFGFYYLLGQDIWREKYLKQTMIIADHGHASAARGTWYESITTEYWPACPSCIENNIRLALIDN